MLKATVIVVGTPAALTAWLLVSLLNAAGL